MRTKLYIYGIAEILLKVELNTTILTLSRIIFIVHLAKGAKWFVIMLSVSVLQCTNGMGWITAEERTNNVN